MGWNTIPIAAGTNGEPRDDYWAEPAAAIEEKLYFVAPFGWPPGPERVQGDEVGGFGDPYPVGGGGSGNGMRTSISDDIIGTHDGYTQDDLVRGTCAVILNTDEVHILTKGPTVAASFVRNHLEEALGNGVDEWPLPIPFEICRQAFNDLRTVLDTITLYCCGANDISADGSGVQNDTGGSASGEASATDAFEAARADAVTHMGDAAGNDTDAFDGDAIIVGRQFRVETIDETSPGVWDAGIAASCNYVAVAPIDTDYLDAHVTPTFNRAVVMLLFDGDAVVSDFEFSIDLSGDNGATWHHVTACDTASPTYMHGTTQVHVGIIVDGVNSSINLSGNTRIRIHVTTSLATEPTGWDGSSELVEGLTPGPGAAIAVLFVDVQHEYRAAGA
jgi:hypothetical protein